MVERLLAHDPLLRIIAEHPLEQVRPGGSPECLRGNAPRDRSLRPLRKVGIVVRQPADPRPAPLRRGAPPLKNLEQLVDIGPSGEHGKPGGHLPEDAPHAPHVDVRAVAVVSEEQLRGAVPERHHLVGVGAVGEGEEARQAEIGEFERPTVAADEQVVWL